VYSNQVIARDVPGMGIKSEIPVLEAHGWLKTDVFMPVELREVTPHNAARVGEALALTMCSNCHSLSETGIRPLKNYLGGNTDVGAIKTYLQAALTTGNTLYMPKMPMKDEEAEALAVYLATLTDKTVASRYAAEKGAVAQAVSTKE
jgi:mono/diheme cytochrome c family protein